MSACRFCGNTGLELVSPMLDSAENVYRPCRCKYGQRVAAQQCLHTAPPSAGSYSFTCPKCGTFVGVDFGKSAGG